MSDELTPEQREAIEKAANEKSYGNFKAFMDRYIEEKKPKEDPDNPPVPERTKKPGKTFFQDLFGG